MFHQSAVSFFILYQTKNIVKLLFTITHTVFHRRKLHYLLKRRREFTLAAVTGCRRNFCHTAAACNQKRSRFPHAVFLHILCHRFAVHHFKYFFQNRSINGMFAGKLFNGIMLLPAAGYFGMNLFL